MAVAVAIAVAVAVVVGRVVRIRAWGRAVLVFFRGRHRDLDLYCSRRGRLRRNELVPVWNDYVGEGLEGRSRN